MEYRTKEVKTSLGITVTKVDPDDPRWKLKLLRQRERSLTEALTRVLNEIEEIKNGKTH